MASKGSGKPAAALPASYEAARDELTTVVGTLEAGGLTLEESLTLWERGEALAAHCADLLDGARARVERALAAADESSADEASADDADDPDDTDDELD